MAVFKRNVHLGTKDPLIETDDIADKAVTKEKLADGIILPTKTDIIYLRWWDNEDTSAHKEEANPGDYFYKADTDSLYVAKEIEGSVEWERIIIESAILYVKIEGDKFGIGKIKEQWGTLLKLSSSDISDLIPEEASATNKLADKNYVNTGISTATADFKGTFNSLEGLQEVTDANANDYGFVIVTDGAGNTVYKRYKYVEGTGWQWEYDINNSGFTAAQWATINSGITSSDKTIINFIGDITDLDTRDSSNIISALNALQGDLNSVVKKIIVKIGDKNSILETLAEFEERELDFDKYEEYWRDSRYILYHLGDTTTNPATNDSVLIILISEQDTYSLQVATLEDIIGDKANLNTTNKTTLVDAINEVNGIANKAYDTIGEVETFSTSENYHIGDYVIYNNKLYKFTSNHTAGAWVAADVEETTIVEQLEEFTTAADGLTNKVKNFEGALVGNTQIEEFSESTTYGTEVSQVHYCYRNNLLYAAIATHIGAWNAAHFEQVSILEITIPVYENVLIELKTFAEGTPIDDVNVTVKVEGEADARTLTTNADGKCSTTILRGLTYTITFPHIDNYIDLETISRQAAIAQRTIVGKYRSILNPDTETVTVQVNYHTAGNKATSFDVIYDETSHVVNIDPETDSATFTVPEGYNYTIEMPYVEGYRTPADVSFIAEGGSSRSIRRLYHPYIEDGIFWKMKDGSIRELADITREDYDNDRIFGLAFTTSTLQGGNEFIIPFRYLLSGYGLGVWMSPYADVTALEPIATQAAGAADLSGEENCRIIREFCKANNAKSDVAQTIYNLVFQVDGIERRCFAPAYGQFLLLYKNRNTIDSIFNRVTGAHIGVLDANFWTSSKCSSTSGVVLSYGNFTSDTMDKQWNILPVLSYL